MFILECTSYYTLREASQERCYYLDSKEKRIRLTFCQLLALRERLNKISVEELFNTDKNQHDLTIVTLCGHQYFFLLSTLEVIDLKKVIRNAFVVMGLSHSPVVQVV